MVGLLIADGPQGTGREDRRMKKLIVCIALLLSTAAAQAQLHGATTTTVNSTISVTNAFQAALAANTGRAACVLQNTGTHTMYVYFGVLADRKSTRLNSS